MKPVDLNEARKELVYMVLDCTIDGQDTDKLKKIFDRVFRIPSSVLRTWERAWRKKDEIDQDEWSGTEAEYNHWEKTSQEVIDMVEDPIMGLCRELFPRGN